MSTRCPRTESYVIAGATAPLSQAIAFHLAHLSETRALGLVAQDQNALDKVRLLVGSRYPSIHVETLACNPKDFGGVEQVFMALDGRLGPISTIIINPTVSIPPTLRETFYTHLIHATALVDAALKYSRFSRAERQGRKLKIVVVSSYVARWPGTEDASFYASIKGLEAWVDSVRSGPYEAEYVVVRPGIISELFQNTRSLTKPIADLHRAAASSASPLAVLPTTCAADIISGVRKGKGLIYSPAYIQWFSYLVALLPAVVTQWLVLLCNKLKLD